MKRKLLHLWLWHTDTDYRIFLEYRQAIRLNADDLITDFYKVTLTRLQAEVGKDRTERWWKAMPR